MTAQLAKAIVRRYPATWRERYEVEVLSLLNNDGPALTPMAGSR